MSMSKAFEFESFDPLVEEELPDLPVEPQITDADVEAARRSGIQMGVQQGFEAGEKKAREELEKLFAQAADENDTAVEKLFEQLATQFDVVFAQQRAEVSLYTRQMLQMTRLLWQRLMPKYFEEYGCAEVEAVVEDALQFLRGAEKITIEYSQHDSAQLLKRLEPLQKIYAGRSELEFCVSDALEASNVRLSWRDGFAERDTVELMRFVDDIVEKTLQDFADQQQRDEQQQLGL